MPRDRQAKAVRARLRHRHAFAEDGSDAERNRSHWKVRGTDRSSSIDPRAPATSFNLGKRVIAASRQEHHVITGITDGNRDRSTCLALKGKGNRVGNRCDHSARHKGRNGEDPARCSTPVTVAHVRSTSRGATKSPDVDLTLELSCSDT
jgi:hypothetical protein